MFEKATRLKVRFETPQGLLSTEDLWDLPLTTTNGNRASLDDIAMTLHRHINENKVESFVNKTTKSDEKVQVAFDIVKHIIEVRLAEKEAAENVRKNKEKKAQILALIAQKDNEELSGKTKEELRAMAESL